MRSKIILALLAVSFLAIDAEAQLLGRRRSRVEARRSPSMSEATPYCPDGKCPNGVCPVPQSQSVPSQPSAAPFGYQNLTPPKYEARPVAPAPVPTQPAQAVVASSPPPPVAAPAASPQALSADKFAELTKLLEGVMSGMATAPVVAQPDPPKPPAPPTPPQEAPATSSKAGEVVSGLGIIEVVHRDGNGNTVQSAVIDLSEFVRKEIGAKE